MRKKPWKCCSNKHCCYSIYWLMNFVHGVLKKGAHIFSKWAVAWKSNKSPLANNINKSVAKHCFQFVKIGKFFLRAYFIGIFTDGEWFFFDIAYILLRRKNDSLSHLDAIAIEMTKKMHFRSQSVFCNWLVADACSWHDMMEFIWDTLFNDTIISPFASTVLLIVWAFN